MQARSTWVAAAVVAALFGADHAGAQDLEGRWTFALEAGTDSEISGTLLDEASGSVYGLPLTLYRRSYRDVERPKVRWQALLGYGVAPAQEVVVKGTYYKVSSDGVAAGSMRGSDVFAYFTDYKEVGGELAYRFYLATRTRLKSYVAPVVGVRFTEARQVSFTAPSVTCTPGGDIGCPIEISNVPLYKQSTIPVFGADIGFGFDLGENVYIGLETGIRYQTRPGEENAVPGFEAIDDGGDRWSAPVVLQLGFRF